MFQLFDLEKIALRPRGAYVPLPKKRLTISMQQHTHRCEHNLRLRTCGDPGSATYPKSQFQCLAVFIIMKGEGNLFSNTQPESCYSTESILLVLSATCGKHNVPFHFGVASYGCLKTVYRGPFLSFFFVTYFTKPQSR